jgi:hypothetical protein
MEVAYICQYSAEREHPGEAGSPASGLAEGAGRTAFGATGLRMTDKPRRLAVAEPAVEVVRRLLGDPTSPDLVRELVAEDSVYVSLNFADPDLKRIMPWCGTGRGSRALLQTFTDLSRSGPSTISRSSTFSAPTAAPGSPDGTRRASGPALAAGLPGTCYARPACPAMAARDPPTQ